MSEEIQRICINGESVSFFPPESDSMIHEKFRLDIPPDLYERCWKARKELLAVASAYYELAKENA